MCVRLKFLRKKCIVYVFVIVVDVALPLLLLHLLSPPLLLLVIYANNKFEILPTGIRHSFRRVRTSPNEVEMK